MGYKVIKPVCKTLWCYLLKLKLGQPFDPAVLLLGYTPDQKLASYVLEGRSGPLFKFGNKVLLEHTHASLFTYCLWLLLCCNGRVEL